MLAALLRNRVVREAVIFLAFCLFTAALTWPYVAHLRDGMADAGDPYFVSWVLWWDYHQTFADPLNLFHSNLFFPFRYTLAFSEHSYGIALFFFPLYALGVHPLTVHAVAVFLAFSSSGYAAFRLGRTLTGSIGAGWITGIAFAFVPFRFSMLSHLHYLFAMWIPLLFEALILFARERSWKRAIWLGSAFFMSGLTSLTWFVFSLVPLATAAAILVVQDGLVRDRRFWQRAAVTLAVASLALLPFLLPYSIVSKTYHFVRSIDDVKDGSAQALHWLVAEGRNHLWRGLGDNLSCGTRFRLFPGSLPIVLAVAGIVLHFRKTDRVGKFGGRRDAWWLGLILTSLGFVYSLGWNSFFYRILYDLLPIFRSIRITARGAMFAYLGLAVLAGLGANCLIETFSCRPARFRPAAVFVLIAGLLLFELNASPLELVHGDLSPDALSQRFKETPMRGGLVFLPPTDGLNHRRTFQSTVHGKPLITGTSGFNSPDQGRIYAETAAGPIRAEFMQLLEEIPASYVVVQTQEVPPERRVSYEAFLGRAVAAGRLRYINRFDGHDDLYAVTKTEPDSRAEAPFPFVFEIKEWAALLEADSVNLLGEYRAWSQALYRLHLAAFGAMPRYADFLPDVVELGRGVLIGVFEDQRSRLDDNLNGLAEYLAARPQFKALHDSESDPAFIDRIAANTGAGLPDADRASLVEKLASGALTRSGVLLSLATNEGFRKREETRSLVLLHYFGYLRRNPDDAPDRNLDGFNYWLRAVEASPQTDGLSQAFMASTEYSARPKK